jgi:hypothetical protein
VHTPLLLLLVMSDPAVGLAHDGPGAQRTWLAPAGVTAPAGTLDLDVRLLLVGATYAPTDWLELGLSTLAVYPGFFMASGKWAPLQGPRGGLALTGDLVGLPGLGDDGELLVMVGLAGSLCVTRSCATVLGGSWTPDVVGGFPRSWHILTASLVQRITGGVSAVLELDHGLHHLDPNGGFQRRLFWYGARFHSPRWALGVGMFVGSDYFFGAPWITLSRRFRVHS